MAMIRKNNEAMPVKNRIELLIKAMSEGIWEKDYIFALGLLTAVAEESLFLLGPPGTGKSLVARRLKQVFKDSRSFEYLMSRFSTPDEIFGPVSIKKLKEEDRYERATDGFLPTADIVFLDEIWKAGPPIQNALLTAINEKVFHNGPTTQPLPLKVLVAASNELPRENEGLEALWDRFMVRVVSNCIENENAFYRMMRQKETRLTDIKSELQIDNATLADWKSCCENVELPDSILEAITHIRHGLRQLGKRENVEPLDYYISDRRWKKAANLLRTSAFLNDRTEVDMSDIVLLQHMLWNNVECIRPVTQLVLESLFADIQKSMADLSKEMQKAPEENARQTERSNRNAFQVYHFFYAKLLPPTNAKQTDTVYFLLNNYEQLSLSKPSDGIIYYDDNLKGFVVRKMDVKMSAEQLRSIQNLTATENRPMAVKLKRGADSIFIDNTEYQLEKAKFGGSLLGTNNLINKQYVPNLANLHFEESAYAIRTKFEERKSLLLAKNGNLFVNNTDTTNLKRYCQNLEKAINALEVKVNTLKTKQ